MDFTCDGDRVNNAFIVVFRNQENDTNNSKKCACFRLEGQGIMTSRLTIAREKDRANSGG